MHRAVGALRRRPALAHLRSPLSRLVRRGWIWEGRQELDGVYAARGAETRRHLAPFLASASDVLETSDGCFLLFADPVEFDCAALGAVLPLRRLEGALTSFPFDPPLDPEIVSAIDGRLLLIEGGALRASPLADAQPADLSDWVTAPEIEIQQSLEPPRSRRAARRSGRLPIKSATLSDPDDADAGLAVIRERVASSSPPPIALGRLAGRIATGIGLAALALLILAIFSSGAGTPAGGGVFLGLLAVAAVFALSYFSGRRGSPVPPTQQQETAPGASASTRPTSPAAQRKGGLSRWIAVALIAGATLFLAISGRAPDILVGVMILAILFLLLSAFAALVSLVLPSRGEGEGASGGKQASAPPRSPPVSLSGPGWLQRLFERLLRQTPLSDHALGQYRRRVHEIERLFGEGRTDEALKKALAVDPTHRDGEDVRADTPLSGPGVRKQLKISSGSVSRRQPLAALPSGARQRLEALYRSEAERLREAGEIDRAAFIHAELLGEDEKAVKLFADAGKFETAARLARGRGLAPAVFIPLWARAGRLDLALELAERHGAYEVLLNASDELDPAFEAQVRQRWARRLASVGARLDALRVSAPLVATVPEIADLRRQWMAEALGLPEPDPEIVARAAMALPLAAASPDAAVTAVEALVRADGDVAELTAPQRRKALAEALLKADLEPEKDPAFDHGRLPRIADQLARRLAADASRLGLSHNLGLPRALAEAGGQAALAADLRTPQGRRSKKKQASGRPKMITRTRQLALGAIRGAAAVVAAAPLAGERVMIGYEDGRVELMGPGGKPLWSHRLWRIRDIVAVRPGRRAIIIGEDPSGQQLHIFDADMMRCEEIGPVSLDCWAPYASADGWLVYDGRSVLDLSIAPLLSPLDGRAPEALEQKWAVPITIEGEMQALSRSESAGDVVWLFQRADGALERWTVTAGTLRVAYSEITFSNPARALVSPDLTSFEKLSESAQLITVHMRYGEVPAERRSPAPKVHLLQQARQTDAFRLAIFGAEATTPAPSRIGVANREGRAPLTVDLDGATNFWLRDSSDGRTACLHDDLGRFMLLSPRRNEVLTTNAELRDIAP